MDKIPEILKIIHKKHSFLIYYDILFFNIRGILTFVDKKKEVVTMVPKMEVKCSVDTCHYWKSEYCHADNLEVNPTGDMVAHTSDGTCCTTFRPNK